MEAADETDHFDYAISLAQAHRLLPAKSTAVYPTYNLRTDFLETYTDFARIDLNLHDRVPALYGTKYYFDRIDRRARLELPSSSTVGPMTVSPILLPFYPFGYYALDAIWMNVFGNPRSIVDTFYAARWFSIALLAITLTFTYAASRALGLQPPLALAITAVIGLFSLTSYVASYVQPDNLTWCCYAAAIYVTARIKERVHILDLTTLGFIFGILVVTKYQFYICLVPLVVVSLAARFLRKTSGLQLVAAVLVLFTPSLLAFGAQAIFVGSNPAFTASAVGHFTGSRFFALVPQAFWHFFIAGFHYELDADPHFSGATSYWGNSGWLDTPLTFGDTAVDTAIHLVIQATNVLIIVATTSWVLQTTIRLIKLARTNRRNVAFRLLFQNTTINLYFFYIVFMIIFYALTDNNWRVSGRLWLPLILPAFLLGIKYAPKALPRRLRRSAGMTIFAMLVFYSTVGSFFAVSSAVQRYYGSQYLPPVGTISRGPATQLDVRQVNAYIDPTKAPVGQTGDLIPGSLEGQQVQIAGWAADLERDEAASGVTAVIDRKEQVPGSYGFATQSMSEALRRFKFFWAGYRVTIPTDRLGYGVHDVALFLISKDRKVAHEAIQRVSVVVDPARPFQIGDKDRIFGSIDAIGPIDRDLTTGDAGLQPVWIDFGQPMLVRGWAFDRRVMGNPRRIVAVIDGRRTFAVRLGQIAATAPDALPGVPLTTALYAGFSVLVPTSDLEEGTHDLAIVAFDDSGRKNILLNDFAFGVEAHGQVDGATLPVLDRPFPIEHDNVEGSIQVIGSQANVLDGPHAGPVYVAQANELFIKGWAYDRTLKRSVRNLRLTIDGKTSTPMRTGLFDAAAANGDDGAFVPKRAYSGFSVLLPLEHYSRGVHRLQILDTDNGQREALIAPFVFAVY